MRLVRKLQDLKSSKSWRVFWQLLKSARPISCVFSVVATLIGFYALDQNDSSTDSLVIFVVSSISMLATASVMLFNDYIDAAHDLKKGKYFAFENRIILLNAWKAVSCFALIGLLFIIHLDPYLGILCIMIYALGLVYSFSRKCFLLQNILVGLCATSPLIFGSVYYRFPSDSPLLPGASILLSILIGEVMKDLRDVEIDVGYKNTIPVIYSEVATRIIVGILATGSLMLLALWHLLALSAAAPLLLPIAYGLGLVRKIPSIIIERAADVSITLVLAAILIIGLNTSSVPL